MSQAADHDSTSPTHQNCRWIDSAARDVAHAEFLETVFDVAAGPGEAALPAVG
jgi:hypothetical protein